MEDTEDIDRAGNFNHVGDSLAAVQQDADMPVWSLPVPVSLFGKLSEDFDLLIERFNGTGCGGGIVLSDVVVDVMQPSLGF